MTHEKQDKEPSLEFGGAFGPGPRETVADLLRRARQDCGQSLRSVADNLCIRPAYLEALESGDLDQLPGTTYAIGFLRTYADYLGLDAEDMVERFKAETQASAPRTELVFPEPAAEGRIPGGAIILVSVVLLGVAYGGWFYLSQQGRTVADLIPAWPTETQSVPTESQTAASDETGPAAEPAEAAGIVTAASAQASTASPDEAESTAPEAPVAETPVADTPVAESPALVAPTLSQTSETPVIEPAIRDAPVPATVAVEPQADPTPAALAPDATIAAEAPPATPDEPTTLASLVDRTVVIPAPPSSPETVIIPDDRSPRVYGGSNDESRIVIRALQDSWVQVRDAQDAILLTRVLRAGDSYRVPNVTGLTLLTGNAGGIELEVDGVRLPPAGPPGSVRRSIDLNPARLLSGTSANR